jgi:protein involved in polysaccharide export with SLBB domain
MEVGGLTEDGLAKELDQRLEKYMYSPEASVFVDEYRNREAAVVGAVNHPGLVLLDTPSETILDVITKAGGLSNKAADQLILIPVEQGGSPAMGRVSSIARQFETNHTKADDPPASRRAVAAAPDSADSAELHATSPTESVDSQKLRPKSSENDFSTSALQMLPSNARPISISLRSTSLTGAGKYLNLPARPGDVIVVPGGGDVMVVGWVHRPGYFAVGSGLTVMGAIGAAGGPMFAANTDEVTLIRSTKGGSKVVLPVNLEKISKGEESDIPVKANDVIDVPYSGLRIGPYIFYSILSRMGIGAPIPAL